MSLVGDALYDRIPTSRMHLFDEPYSSHMAFTELADESDALSRACVDENATA